MALAGIHSTFCAVSGCRTVRHNNIARLVLVQAGFTTQREVLVSEWRDVDRGKLRPAILKVLCINHTWLRPRWIDVSARQFLAEMYSHGNHHDAYSDE